LQMVFSVWEDGMKQAKSLAKTRIRFLSVLHWAFSRKSPKADFRVDFDHPPLAVRLDRIIHLVYLGCDAQCLLAQPPRRLQPIDRACLCIGLRSQCGAAGRREDAAATRLTEQLPSSLSHALGPSSNPMGMSMATQARSGGRLPRTSRRSATSTDVVNEGTSTLNATYPARHPSTPATSMED